MLGSDCRFRNIYISTEQKEQNIFEKMCLLFLLGQGGWDYKFDEQKKELVT